MGTDNGKKKSAQEPKENLDLVMENDNWAASAGVISRLLAPLHRSPFTKITKATPETVGTNVSRTTKLWKRV